jgi:ABC-2 type transport system ATP-binding protein
MQEVEAICDRVIIIKKGAIVANDKAENLKQNSLLQVVLVEFDKASIDEVIGGLSHDIRAEKVSDTTWSFSSSSAKDVRKVIFDLAVKNGLSVLSMVKQEEKMEDIFKRYTN